MAPITIQVRGESTITHRAERAILNLSIQTESTSQEDATKRTFAITNSIKPSLIDLAKKNDAGEPSEDAAVTGWTMTSLSTGNRVLRDRDQKIVENKFTATTTFTVKFQDFAQLGTFATTWAGKDDVSIRSVTWSLTDVTKEALGRRSRHEAVENAVMKAKDYADALGLGEPKVTQLQDGSHSMSNHAHMARKMARPRGADGRFEQVGEEIGFEPEDVQLKNFCTVHFEVGEQAGKGQEWAEEKVEKD